MWLIRYWKPLAVLVLLAAVYGWGRSDGRTAAENEHLAYQLKVQKATTKAAEAAQKALQAVREQERRHAEALAKIAEKYEQDKRDAERKQAGVVADLRAGNLRLRNHWQGCQAAARVSAAASAARESDAVARVREEAAGRIVRIGAEADAQVRGLQEVIRKDREQ
jgi:hypothetical protein